MIPVGIFRMLGNIMELDKMINDNNSLRVYIYKMTVSFVFGCNLCGIQQIYPVSHNAAHFHRRNMFLLKVDILD